MLERLTIGMFYDAVISFGTFCVSFQQKCYLKPFNLGMSRFLPPTARLMSERSRLNFSARLCNLGLNPDALRPLARIMSRFSRLHVQTFQTQTLGASMQLGSESGCGATLGTTHAKIFQTLYSDFPDSSSRRDWAIWIWIRRGRDPQSLDMSLGPRTWRGMSPLVIRIYLSY